MKALKIIYRICLSITFLIIAAVVFMAIVGYHINKMSFDWIRTYEAFAVIFTIVGFVLTFFNKKIIGIIGLVLLGIGCLSICQLWYGALLLTKYEISYFVLCILSLLHYLTSVILYIVWKANSKNLDNKKTEDIISDNNTNSKTVAGDEDVIMGKLLKLKELQEKNIITEEEFEEKKKELLEKFVQ